MSGLEWTTGCGKEGGKRVHLLKKGGALGSGQEVSWLPALVNGLQQWNDTVYHFSTVFALSFLALLGGVQIFLIRWRFKGGELGRH